MQEQNGQSKVTNTRSQGESQKKMLTQWKRNLSSPSISYLQDFEKPTLSETEDNSRNESSCVVSIIFGQRMKTVNMRHRCAMKTVLKNTEGNKFYFA